MSDWIDQLERMTLLHKNGALSDDEFAVKKAQILGQARNSDPPLQQPIHISEPSSLAKPSTWAIGGLAVIVLGLLIWVFTLSGLKQNESPDSAHRVPAPQVIAANPNPAPTEAAPKLTVPQSEGSDQQISYNPSYHCRLGQSRELNIICHNRELSEKDRRLSTMYKIILAEAPIENRQQLIFNQRRLLAERSICGDVYCMSDWYDRTIALYQPAFESGSH